MPTNAYRVKALSRLRIVALDACGRIPVTGSVLLDSTSGIQSIGFTPQVTETGAETTTAIDGSTCIDSTATYSNSGKTVSLLGCGINRQLEAAFGWLRQIDVTNGGWDEIDNTTDAQVLIEMSFKLPSTNCAAGAATIISSMHVVTAWRPDGDLATNGSDTMHMNWQGDSVKVPARLFELFTTPNIPSGEFAHWANYWQATYAGDAWAKWTDAVTAPTYPASPSTTFRAVTD